MPGVFRNPTDNDTIAFAQISLFVPQRRLVWGHFTDRQGDPGGLSGGGIPGYPNPFPSEDPDAEPSPEGESWWAVVLQSGSWHGEAWSLFNQNWTAQMTPATTEQLPYILSTEPYVLGDLSVQLPRLTGLDSQDIRWINHH